MIEGKNLKMGIIMSSMLLIWGRVIIGKYLLLIERPQMCSSSLHLRSLEERGIGDVLSRLAEECENCGVV